MIVTLELDGGLRWRNIKLQHELKEIWRKANPIMLKSWEDRPTWLPAEYAVLSTADGFYSYISIEAYEELKTILEQPEQKRPYIIEVLELDGGKKIFRVEDFRDVSTNNEQVANRVVDMRIWKEKMGKEEEEIISRETKR